MEELNKKTLLRVFLGFIFIQVSVLLAISANFLLAQTFDTANTTTNNELTVENTDSSATTSDTSTIDYTTYPDDTTTPSDKTIYDTTLLDDTRVIDYTTINDATIANDTTTPDISTVDNTTIANDTTLPDDTNTADNTIYTDDTITSDNTAIDDTIIADDTTYTDDKTISDTNTVDDTTISDNITDSLIISFIERFESPFSGDQQISISSNQEIFSCVFKIYGPKYAEFPAIKDSPNNCHIILHTKDFPDGYYTIKAVAGNNIGTAEIRLDAEIKNQIAIEPDQPPITKPAPTEQFYPTESVPAEYDLIETDSTEQIYIQPEQPAIKITPECIDQGVNNQEECDQLMKNLFRLTFECKNANITSPEECDKYMMENFMPHECKEAGITTKEECDYLLRNTYASFESFFAVEITPPYTAQIEEEIPDECKKQGITSFEECKKHMMLINMPEECRQAGATNPEECEKIMFKKYGPQECIQAHIFNPDECEKFMFEKYAPDDCREAGILNPEACKKYMFEKYGGKENISLEKFPIECQKANVKTIEECEKIMKKIYLPQECVNEGLENEYECEIYLQQKHMPEECRDAGAKSREECDKIMFKQFGPPECQKAGIEDENKCKEFMLNKYAQKVKCDNIEDWQCKNFIKERHLGNIIAKQIKYNEILEKKDEMVGESMKVEDIEAKIIQEEKIVPITRKDLGIKIIATNKSIVLDEEDNLIQTAPIAFMIDSDEDGLPDDMEKRFGTDPFKADTDEDGHNDGEEVKNGYNPLGEGELEEKLAPIEKAIMENIPLGHPTIEGEEVENFFVKNISNMENAQGNLIEGYVLSGKTKPNSVATLYIYSDLPVVVTVDADQYGNWRYQLDQSLIEGEHEVYIAINDDTGKVIEKSKPLNFFIKEAKAVSVKDFVSIAKASSEEPKESEVSIYNYLLITLLMAIAGILLFLAIIINKKKNQSLRQ